MAKTILQEQEARLKLKAGADKVADIVKVTLGPSGKTVVISEGYLKTPIVTKDGVSVARSVTMKDELESVGAQLMKSVSEKTLDQAGDGTTTSTVIAQSILSSAMTYLDQNINPREMKAGMDFAVKTAVKYLDENSIKINSKNDKIKDVATVSANNDSVIGGLIAEAFSQIGDDGVLSIEPSATDKTYITVTKGVEIGRGYIHPYMVTDPSKQQAVLENPLILVTDYELMDPRKDMIPYLTKVAPQIENGRPVLLYVNNIDQGAYSFAVMNREKNLNVFVCRAPGNVFRKDILGDVAALTGATLISDENGIKLENVEVSHFGSAKKVVITGLDTNGKTLFVEGAGKPEEIERRIAEIKAEIENTSDEQLKKVNTLRLAKFTGSVGQIHVGAITDVERKEKMDRVDDAVRATKSAIEEGIAEGGGVALLRTTGAVGNIKEGSDSFLRGVWVIKNALESPIRQILSNAHIDNIDAIVTNIKDGANGYSLKTFEFEDFIAAGIIDPVKVIRVALENANSVASMIIGSAGLVAETKNI